ncbi:MAG: hypothetical protein H6500_05560 [Candidatus Woesearchaeota archaeon]|nr:MAG: hypothetical protein H6500_05560 [Candidatus Woesearchaeota archaeon]
MKKYFKKKVYKTMIRKLFAGTILLFLLVFVGLVYAQNLSSENSSLEVKELNESNSSLSNIKVYDKKQALEKYILKTSKTVPTEGIDDDLREKLRNANSQSYLVFQFFTPLSKEDISVLFEKGINVLEYQGANAYLVAVSPSSTQYVLESDQTNFSNLNYNPQLNSFLGSTKIRSVLDFSLEQKFGPVLQANTLSSDYLDEEAYAYLTVHIHKDVSLDDAQIVLEKKGLNVVSQLQTLHALTVRVYVGDEE